MLSFGPICRTILLNALALVRGLRACLRASTATATTTSHVGQHMPSGIPLWHVLISHCRVRRGGKLPDKEALLLLAQLRPRAGRKDNETAANQKSPKLKSRLRDPGSSRPKSLLRDSLRDDVKAPPRDPGSSRRGQHSRYRRWFLG